MHTEEAHQKDQDTRVGEDRKFGSASIAHFPPAPPKPSVLPSVSSVPFHRVYDPFRAVVGSTARNSMKLDSAVNLLQGLRGSRTYE